MRPRPRASRLVLVLAGVLLLAGAVAKGHALATRPATGGSFLDTRWFGIVWMEVELALGVWLLSGLWARRAWAAAVLVFGVFSVVTLAKAVRGDASCGCFGVIEVKSCSPIK